MLRFSTLCAAWLAALAAGRLVAQDAALEQAYGEGVHSYFAGNHQKSLDLLTAAIDGGFQDARAHFFRGMALTSLGDSAKAQQDFMHGADLEAADADQTPSISRALQRVQGPTRLALEKHRAEAKLRALRKQKADAEQKYGKESSPRPPAAKKAAPAPAPKRDEEVFDSGEEAKPKEKPAEEDADAKPAEEEKTPAKKPAAKAPKDGDLFSDEPAPAKKPTPKAAPEDEMPAEDPAADAKPAPKKSKAAEADPFSDEKPAEKKPAEKKPAKEAPAEEEPAKEEPAKEEPAKEETAKVGGGASVSLGALAKALKRALGNALSGDQPTSTPAIPKLAGKPPRVAPSPKPAQPPAAEENADLFDK